MNPYAFKEIFSAAYPQDLEPIVRLLAAQGIESHIETHGSPFNPNLAFTRAPDTVRLLVAGGEYDEAMKILVQMEILDGAGPEAGMREMLGDLDNDELLEMVVDAQHQPADQVAMARKLLAERGVAVSDELLAAKTEAIDQSEQQPKEFEPMDRFGLSALFLVLPVLGLAGCLFILLFTTTDARGAKYKRYSPKDRMIFGIVGLVNIALWVAVFWFMTNVGRH
jgi:hypothetical protein